MQYLLRCEITFKDKELMNKAFCNIFYRILCTLRLQNSTYDLQEMLLKLQEKNQQSDKSAALR